MPRRHPTLEERDERVAIPLDPEEAHGLFAVRPDDVGEDDQAAPIEDD